MSIDKETVYDYYVDPSTKTWKVWEAEQWQVPKRLAFSQLLIPTIDSTRAEFIIHKIANLPAMRSRKEEGARPAFHPASRWSRYCQDFGHPYVHIQVRQRAHALQGGSTSLAPPPPTISRRLLMLRLKGSSRGPLCHLEARR